VAGEIAMLLREDPREKAKLDLFRRLEASNKHVCQRALAEEGVARPQLEPTFYRAGLKLGMRFGEGCWNDFLDRFQATLHPEAFRRYLVSQDGNEITPEHAGVNLSIFRHLIAHEQSLVRFVALERAGGGEDSTCEMKQLLSNELCRGLVGPDDPVGW
jgi:hypothetical protein